MTTHAISWAAVSSKPQADRESLNDQHRLNHALAEALDWDIVEDITVPGESRSYHRLSRAQQNIDAYKQLDEFVQSGAVNWIIVKDRSRLGRTRRLVRELDDYLHDHGTRVYSRTMPPASTEKRTQSDVWGEAIEQGMSEAEILTLKQRREMGMQARVRAGKLPSTPPWGFQRVANEQGNISYVFADPRAEEAVRFAITRYQAGISILHIVQEAHEGGMRTAQGKDWKLTTVSRTVLQPAYYGLTAWGRQRTSTRDGKRRVINVPPDQWLIAEGDFDAPFTPDDWQLTLAEWQRRRDEHPRRRGTRYPLSGILWCGHCDAPFGGTQTRPDALWYRCSDYWRKGLERRPRQKRHYISMKKVHRLVGDSLRDRLDNPSWLSSMGAARAPDDSHQRDKDLLLEQVSELIRRRQRWMDAYEEGAIELADFSQRIGAIDSEQATLATRLERLDDAIATAQDQEDWLAYAQETMPQLPDMLAHDLTPTEADELRALFSKLFKRITLTDGEVHFDPRWS